MPMASTSQLHVWLQQTMLICTNTYDTADRAPPLQSHPTMLYDNSAMAVGVRRPLADRLQLEPSDSLRVGAA